MNLNKKIILIIILSQILFYLLIESALPKFVVFENNKSFCSVVIPQKISGKERFAVNELNYFVKELTGINLEVKFDSDPLPEGNIILIGTYDNNTYINDLYNKGLLPKKTDLIGEEFIIRTLSNGTNKFLVVTANQDRSVIYGVYEVVENMIKSVTGFKVIDLDFNINRVETLAINDLNMRSKPFYPFRCAISNEDPTWLSRHRINVSGAEGVWTGTGIDDGLGSAFKYLTDPQFDDMQDETLQQRMSRMWNLKDRLWKLEDRGIEAYLFMYIMGEPTKALLANHPELLDAEVKYEGSRNGKYYQPISWTKPEARNLIKELVKSIVATYSPSLKGFHLRSWGWETRAPADNNEQMQKLLWDIYLDIIKSAHEIDPNFKFIISGYDAFWLRDSSRAYISKLPPGTVIMQKWGVDGEPSNNPETKEDYINTIGKTGQQLVIISHDVEEVMPLWMIEADLFAEGVRRYANIPNLKGLGGFTLQGEVGLSHLDRIVSAKLNWDPNEDCVDLMKNYLTSYYGSLSSEYILTSLRYNTKVLSSYFSDYGGTLSLTGKYGSGSRGYATRFWNLIGKDAVNDTLSIHSIKDIEYAKERLSSLLPTQQESANQMTQAKRQLYPASKQAESDYLDAIHIMKMWVRFFESRLRIIEAKEAGYKGEHPEQVKRKIISAVEYSKEIYNEISEIKDFVNVFNYTDYTARESLLALLNKEIEFLTNLDPLDIISSGSQHYDDIKESLSIDKLFVHPNPSSIGADFCYILGTRADEVIIKIYTISGRLVKIIDSASSKMGYNEELWDTRNEEGIKVANGTYIYKITVKKDDKKIEKIGKLSIVR
jgi:hypothetical protein